MSPSPVYLDHAATTPVRAEVLEAMLPYLGPEAFGNPSSAHGFGRRARAGVEQARRQIAEALGGGAEPGDVVFTSGGTEADNLAVLGAALAAQSRGTSMRVVVTASEHKAVLAAAEEVERLGGSSHVVPTGTDGLIDFAELDRGLEEGPAVVSVMWVNNETGVVQPVDAVAERCENRGVVFHTDAVQAVGKLPVSLARFRSVMLTISGHKIGAPKGVGALIVRGPSPSAVHPLVHGGGQQSGVRPGTENVAGIVGLGRAVELAVAEQGEEGRRLGTLRDDLAGRLASEIPDLTILAEGSPRAPHILNVAVPGTDSEAMLMHLDLAGVAASSGSACSTGSVEPSHVLSAMNVPRPLAVAALRFSFGHASTPDDVARAAHAVPPCVAKVRRLAGVLGRG
ncbi:MAG: cysteine desulfurase [Gemmatimonadales bacterium]|nr:cysteine desulfurase [Gemmatimonadales bacterium]